MIKDVVDGPPLPQAMGIKNKGVLSVGVPSIQDLQKWAEQSQSSEDYKQLMLEMFEAALQWLAERRVNVKWRPLSVSSDMERKSLICLQVRQISVSPAVAPLSDVPKVVQSLYQVTNSIQKQHSAHLRPFAEGEIQFVGYRDTDQDDKLQAMLTLKKSKNIEIGLDQITGLILAFFIGNTSSLTDLGQEYKWCPAGNTMGRTWCGITCITKAVSWSQVSRTSVQLGEPNWNDGTWAMTETKCAAIKRLISIMRSGDKTEFINRLQTLDLAN